MVAQGDHLYLSVSSTLPLQLLSKLSCKFCGRSMGFLSLPSVRNSGFTPSLLSGGQTVYRKSSRHKRRHFLPMGILLVFVAWIVIFLSSDCHRVRQRSISQIYPFVNGIFKKILCIQPKLYKKPLK